MRIYYGHLLAVTGASDWSRRSSDRLTLLSNIDNDIRARGNSEFWFVEDLFIYHILLLPEVKVPFQSRWNDLTREIKHKPWLTFVSNSN